MAVALDATTRGGDDSSSPSSYTHTPSGTPRGVLVLIETGNSSTDRVSAVTYGGVSMTRVGTAADTAGEPQRVYAYFLGSSIPTGAQTVSITWDPSGGNFISSECLTFTADTDTEVGDWGILEENQSNPQITLTPDRAALAACVIHSGLSSVGSLTPVSGMSTISSSDWGSFVVRWDRQTTVSASAFTIGYTASSDDVAMIAVSVQEAVSAQDLTGALYSHSSSFFTGTIDAIYDLAGSLFTNTPTFPQGAIDTLYDLAGALFANPGTFPGGGVVANDNAQALDGALFTNTPSFPTGAIDVGAVALTGSLFANTAVFPQGAVLGTYDLDGSLFVNTSTFYAGTITPSVTITGTLFANTAAFPTGLIETGPVTITGVLFENTPSFPTGVIAPGAVTLVGTLYTHTSSFYVGVVFRPVTHPTGTGETIGGVTVGRTADIIILGEVAGAGGPGSLGGASAPGKTDSTSGPGSV